MIAKNIKAYDSYDYGAASPCLKIGDFVYFSGQLPLDEQNKIVNDTIGDEMYQVLRNFVSLLAEMGLELRHIVKTTVYVTNLSDLEEIDLIYATFFAHPFPARSVVEVSKLPYGAKVMVDAIAYDTLTYERQFGYSPYSSEDGVQHDCNNCPDGDCSECQ